MCVCKIGSSVVVFVFSLHDSHTRLNQAHSQVQSYQAILSGFEHGSKNEAFSVFLLKGSQASSLCVSGLALTDIDQEVRSAEHQCRTSANLGIPVKDHRIALSRPGFYETHRFGFAWQRISTDAQDSRFFVMRTGITLFYFIMIP